jgi:hypothetical protein
VSEVREFDYNYQAGTGQHPLRRVRYEYERCPVYIDRHIFRSSRVTASVSAAITAASRRLAGTGGR